MAEFKPTRRKAERDCWCRSCDARLTKNESEGVFWYSSANRGMNIILCLPCCRSIGKMVEEAV